MNDNRIDDLLSSYSENLGHFQGTVPMPVKRNIHLWKPLLVTAMGAAIVAGFVFIPRSAEAATIDKVMSGLNSIPYWHSVAWQLDLKTGAWNSNYSETYLDGLLMVENWAGQRNAVTTLIEPGFVYRYTNQMPYILKNKLGKDQYIDLHFNPATHPWQYYKNRTLLRKDGLTYHGVPAYSLSVSGKKHGTVFEAIVEKSTNLPLITQMQTGNANGHFNYKIEYRYDKPDQLATLRPNSTKPVVYAEQEIDQLVKTWSGIKSISLGRTILSSSISPDGTIWIAHKTKGKDPESFRLTNPNYGNESVYILSNFTGDVGHQKAFEGIVVRRFVPTNDVSPLPTSVDLNFKSGDTVACTLKSETWSFPSYFPCIMYDPNSDLLKSSFYWARADARKKQGDLKGAIEAYMSSYQIEKEAGIYFNTSRSSLKYAADCYEKLGDTAKALELSKLIPKGERGKY